MHESGTSVYVSRKAQYRKRKATGDKRGAEGESASGEDGTVKPATAATVLTRGRLKRSARPASASRRWQRWRTQSTPAPWPWRQQVVAA